jgi:hypothetical protein
MYFKKKIDHGTRVMIVYSCTHDIKLVSKVYMENLHFHFTSRATGRGVSKGIHSAQGTDLGTKMTIILSKQKRRRLEADF